MITMNKLKKYGVEKILTILCFETIFPVQSVKNNRRSNWTFFEVNEQ